ncbi:putative hydrolase YxeP [Roseovarius tolerans]|uniref:Putative hydrolase YxeP n=1 Tax=Roseovarius tolerans TaxID=74031 RepID=A0A0L6CT27_9RHOB|nr:amidohydrolase [Roseovarius tolerans]KNX40663.1 putative hydrolase YxeP [Roseovarius tolerans]
MTLTNSDITELTALRHDLHRHPEISGEEDETARRITTALEAAPPDRLLTGLGGHGVAAVYAGAESGPAVLFRCELDALPIEELGNLPHRSTRPGKGHLCGHDGHMTVLMGLARLLSRRQPARGRAVLLFQPAEETGAGAAAVLADPGFETITPDYAFSLHNMPGLPLGHVGLIPGPVNCASRGMAVTLTGKSAHASEPENGASPMAALSSLMPQLTALSHGTPQDTDFTLATVTHAQMGAPAFGIAPGEATLYVTLRTLTDDRMAALCEAAETPVQEAANAHGLTFALTYHDIFAHCENHPDATQILRNALDTLGITHDDSGLPMRASEDFGRFGHSAKSAMLFLGAGTDHAALHNPDYDFPDDLIPTGAQIFHHVARDLLG